MPAITLRNATAFALIVVAFIALIPGLILPFMDIEVYVKFLMLQKTFLSRNLSVVESIKQLWDNEQHFVAVLILLFSVIVPAAKGVMLSVVLFMHDKERKFKLYTFINSIGKWAMADVFAVGILISFLASKSSQHVTATLQIGYYYFLCHCLVSLLAMQFMYVEDPRDLSYLRYLEEEEVVTPTSGSVQHNNIFVAPVDDLQRMDIV